MTETLTEESRHTTVLLPGLLTSDTHCQQYRTDLCWRGSDEGARGARKLFINMFLSVGTTLPKEGHTPLAKLFLFSREILQISVKLLSF